MIPLVLGVVLWMAFPYIDRTQKHILLKRKFAIMFYTFFLAGAGVLTIIGVLLGGPGWNWTYPWIDGIWFDDLLDWISFRMSIVELSFAAFALVGFLGIVGIVVIVTGRGPKSFNWKKNLDKKALKEDKSQTNFLEPEILKKGETEATVEEIDEPVVESDGAVKLEEKVIYEEISEEEAGITRRQFLTKALRISFGAFAGIQAISWLGFSGQKFQVVLVQKLMQVQLKK